MKSLRSFGIILLLLICNVVFADTDNVPNTPKNIFFADHYFDKIIFSWKENPPEEKVTKYRVYYRRYDALKDYDWKICYEGSDCSKETGRCQGECNNLDYHYIYEFQCRAVNEAGEGPPSTTIVGSPSDDKNSGTIR